MQRIPWIDPLRGVAAGLVLVSHVAYWSGGSGIDGVGRLLARGDVGVAVFFAGSAYLLTRGASAGAAPTRHYWRKRAARILPAYLVALAAVVVVTLAVEPGAVDVRSVLSHLTLLQGYAGESFRGFTQAWSITTEVTFYALVPLICRWLRGCRRDGRSPLPVLMFVAVAGLVVQTLAASSGRANLGAVSTSVIGHAAWFAVGVAAGWVFTADPTTGGSGRRARMGLAVREASPSALLGWAGVTYVAVATPLGGPIHLETPTHGQALVKELAYALIAALLLGAAVRASEDETWPTRAEAQALLSGAGDVSYGLFLWHVLVLQVLFTTLHLTLFHAPFALVLIVTLVVSLALARLSWRVVEAPAIRWAHRSPRG